jgi:hypothetical protein
MSLQGLIAVALAVTILAGCPPPAGQVTVSPGSAEIMVGQEVELEATSTNVNDTSFTWVSSNAMIASVDANGVVTGVAPGGPVTITATGNASGRAGTASITVEESDAGEAPTLVGLDPDKPMVLPFTVQAAYNDDTMFFQMSWEGNKGDTHDHFRYTDGAWQREGGPRREAQATLDNDPLRGPTNLNSTIYESRVTFMLDDPDGPNAVPMFFEMGCMLTCHDDSRHMPLWRPEDGDVSKYLPDDEIFTGSRLDLWHHRLARSNPIGISDDQWVGQRIGGEGDGGGGSRHGDSGTGPFATATFTGGTPQWLFDPSTTPNGEFAFQFDDLWTTPIRYFVDPASEFFGPNAPNPVGIDYAAAVALGYVPSEGDTVPRRRLREATGSRGDITAYGTTFVPSNDDPLFGRWYSNVQRALATGNDDDTDLADGGVYNIAFAVHSGMVTVRDHYVSFTQTLSLEGGDADIQAVKIAGSGRETLPDFSDTATFPAIDLNLFLPGITSDEFLIGENAGLVYIDPVTNLPVDQVHFGANALINQGLGCRDCHTAAASEPFAPVNPGGFNAGSMETLVPLRGGVNTPTPLSEE